MQSFHSEFTIISLQMYNYFTANVQLFHCKCLHCVLGLQLSLGQERRTSFSILLHCLPLMMILLVICTKMDLVNSLQMYSYFTANLQLFHSRYAFILLQIFAVCIRVAVVTGAGKAHKLFHLVSLFTLDDDTPRRLH